MKLFFPLFVLLFSDVLSSEENCAYQAVLNHLQIFKNKDLFMMTRPVKNYSLPTSVHLEVLLYAILDVREIDQTFVSYVWTVMFWQNDYINWKKEDFCGISKISVPTDSLWKPDITIEEMIERDKSTASPYIVIENTGLVTMKNDQVVVSTCRMQVYKFPFDAQSCTLSFKSVVHSDKEISLAMYSNAIESTNLSREVMRMQDEWVFVNFNITTKKAEAFSIQQDMIVYTINMKRHSVLYVVNFIFPVVFFLCLDFASFLMSDTGGEKLGFKITVLLAVTVMQLLLNEILPASSKRIPLIAIYCIGIFFLMLLSLLESIVVLHLINKDQEPDQDQSDLCSRLKDVMRKTSCSCLCKNSQTQIPSDCSVEEDKDSQNKLAEDLQLLHELLVTLLTELLQGKKEKEKPGYWTKKTKTINCAFFISYVTAVVVFLVTMAYLWMQ